MAPLLQYSQCSLELERIWNLMHTGAQSSKYKYNISSENILRKKKKKENKSFKHSVAWELFLSVRKRSFWKQKGDIKEVTAEAAHLPAGIPTCHPSGNSSGIIQNIFWWRRGNLFINSSGLWLCVWDVILSSETTGRGKCRTAWDRVPAPVVSSRGLAASCHGTWEVCFQQHSHLVFAFCLPQSTCGWLLPLPWSPEIGCLQSGCKGPPQKLAPLLVTLQVAKI